MYARKQRRRGHIATSIRRRRPSTANIGATTDAMKNRASSVALRVASCVASRVASTVAYISVVSVINAAAAFTTATSITTTAA